MNAGRDVERLIAGWLTEEAPGRAPDRLLESTADVIDRTKQRRFGAAWRDPVTLSLRTMVAAAAVIIILVAGSAWIGRQTAVSGSKPAPPSIEGVWETTFTREEMLAAGIVEGEDDGANYGHFVLSIHGGTVVTVQLSGPKGGSVAKYTVQANTYTAIVPDGQFHWTFTVTATTLTFAGDGPVTLRVKPWTRIGP